MVNLVVFFINPHIYFLRINITERAIFNFCLNVISNKCHNTSAIHAFTFFFSVAWSLDFMFRQDGFLDQSNMDVVGAQSVK